VQAHVDPADNEYASLDSRFHLPKPPTPLVRLMPTTHQHNKLIYCTLGDPDTSNRCIYAPQINTEPVRLGFRFVRQSCLPRAIYGPGPPTVLTSSSTSTHKALALAAGAFTHPRSIPSPCGSVFGLYAKIAYPARSTDPALLLSSPAHLLPPTRP
jgi:hypothetical protein